MRLSLPWHRTAEKILDLQTRLAVAQEETVATRQAIEEMVRMVASSPMMGAPSAGLRPPSGRPLYAYDSPITFSTPQVPKRRPRSLVTLDTLRELADTYDCIRACIQHLKREVAAVPIEIVSRDAERKSAQVKNRIKAATEFFETPGGLGGPGRRRSHFEAAWIEDLLVIGATCFYFRNTRAGSLFEVVPIDAATIRPRVDAYGWPGPGEKVYEQWIYGVKINEGFTREEMSFDGINATSYLPHFKSPVEWVLRPALGGLAADEWNQTWLTEGTTVTDKLAVPENWTPEMIQDWSDYWDAMLSGNTRERQKTKWIPAGTSNLMNPSRKDQDFEQFQHVTRQRCASMFGVSMASLGYQEQQYKVSQEGSMEHTTQYGVGEILAYRKAHYDDFLVRRGDGDLECVNVVPQEDRSKEKAETQQIRIASGQRTPNEARQEDGLENIDGGDTLFINSQLTPVEHALLPPQPPPGMNGNGGAPGQSSEGASENQGGGSGAALSTRTHSADSRTRLTDALALWEKKALRRLKDGRRALCRFESDDLPEAIHEQVLDWLAESESREQVQRVFVAARDSTRTKEAVGATWRARRERAEAAQGDEARETDAG